MISSTLSRMKRYTICPSIASYRNMIPPLRNRQQSGVSTDEYRYFNDQNYARCITRMRQTNMPPIPIILININTTQIKRPRPSLNTYSHRISSPSISITTYVRNGQVDMVIPIRSRQPFDSNYYGRERYGRCH